MLCISNTLLGNLPDGLQIHLDLYSTLVETQTAPMRNNCSQCTHAGSLIVCCAPSCHAAKRMLSRPPTSFKDVKTPPVCGLARLKRLLVLQHDTVHPVALGSQLP